MLGRPRAFNSPEQLQKLIDEYFDCCDKQAVIEYDSKGNSKLIEKPYTLSGLCNYIGVHRDTLHEYSKLDEYSDTIKKAKARVEQYLEERALNNKVNPIFAMFSLKNNHGWKDKTDIEITQLESDESLPEMFERQQAKLEELKKLLGK